MVRKNTKQTPEEKHAEFELLREIFGEVQGQYKIFLDGFADIKAKTNIYVVVCALFLTLPFSSETIISGISATKITICHQTIPYLKILFILGEGMLVTSIFLLINTIQAMPLTILDIEQVTKSVGTYQSRNVLRGMINNYAENLQTNTETREKHVFKRIRWAEMLIKSGISLIVMSLFILILVMR